MASQSDEKGVLLVYGSPLLDIIVNHPSGATLLEKYDLQPNGSVFAEDKHLAMYQDLEENWTGWLQYAAGGTALNAARVVQWLVQKPSMTSFFGGIGTDKNGQILQTQAERAGVHAVFHTTDSMPTGTCVTICTGDNRSMISRQAAARCFSEEDLCVPRHWTLVEKAQFFYTVSFSLATNPAVMFRLARHAADQSKTFCLNLSAPFLCRQYKESMCRLLPYVHFLFGNQAELDEFGKVHDWQPTGGDRRETAKRMATWPRYDQNRPRVVIITQGSDPVLLATEDTVTEFPVCSVPPETIVDSSGAGDAFVGGFLAQLIRHQCLSECVRCGIYASSAVLTQPGCSFPQASDYRPASVETSSKDGNVTDSIH